jgi:serine/threonine protein kinase/tetratricopeptide (TPR) repeat protein
VKCPKCSLPNAETQRFCGDCGTSLVLDEGAEVTRTTTLNLPTPPLPPGSIFAGRYRIIEELGKGGMGRVFRALDKKLDEEIAIKFIRPDLTEDPKMVERFRTELKAARQVIHKNVARMFDLNEEDGVPYITMEYVRGGDLKSLIRKMGRLNAQQAVRIVRQVAEGLGEAHRTGVIHRDLKPHNIMVDEEGTARITDFGLARLRKTDDATLTAPGMGTPAYASPEQVEGADVDARSDLYSLGITLYEMLTGELPFKGDSPYSVALARLTKTPPNPRSIQPDIPEALVHIIMKCLEREREKRYQNAEELGGDLDAWEKEPSTWKFPSPEPDPIWIRTWTWIKAKRMPVGMLLAVVILGITAYLLIPPKGPWKTSIAVLPVIDMRPAEESANLSYGLQSDISEILTGIPELRVVPSQHLADPPIGGYKEIGKELGADYLLQLTLQTEGTGLRVRVDLFDVRSSSVIPFSYTPELFDKNDIYAIQDQIAEFTANALKVNLVEERLRSHKKRETANLEALYCYWEGKRLIENVYHKTLRAEDFDQVIKMYKRAIELDPDYALAYWGLGNAYEARYNNTEPGIGKDPEDLRLMKEYYRQAYSKNPDYAETHLGLGWAYFYMVENADASQSFRRAFDLEPNKFVVNYDVGAFLRSVGLYDKANKYFVRAAQINPNSVQTRIMISSSWMCLGEYGKALSEIKKALEQEPDRISSRFYSASIFVLMNRLDEAEREIAKARKFDTEGKALILPTALLYAARGNKEEALRLLNGKNYIHLDAACVYIYLDMKGDAIRAIEEGIKRGFEEQGHYLYSYPMLAKNPIFRSLKKESRFKEILGQQKAKYEEYLNKFAKF